MRQDLTRAFMRRSGGGRWRITEYRSACNPCTGHLCSEFEVNLLLLGVSDDAGWINCRLLGVSDGAGWINCLNWLIFKNNINVNWGGVFVVGIVQRLEDCGVLRIG